jgi:hypothetical protein
MRGRETYLFSMPPLRISMRWLRKTKSTFTTCRHPPCNGKATPPQRCLESGDFDFRLLCNLMQYSHQEDTRTSRSGHVLFSIYTSFQKPTRLPLPPIILQQGCRGAFRFLSIKRLASLCATNSRSGAFPF